MECDKRNDLVLSYLRRQVEQAEAEIAIRTEENPDSRRKALDDARTQLAESRKELVEHCTRHGC
jgi:hypothetical protein